MKHISRLFVLITVCLTVAIGRVAFAQTGTNSLAPVTTIPTNGTFWSMQFSNFPPFPFDPFPDLPLYAEDGATGVYYFDDLNTDWSPLGAPEGHSDGARTMDDGPPVPGISGGGGSGSGPQITLFIPPAPGYFPCETWTNFWLEISNSSATVSITISNTLPGLTYLLLEKSNLTQPEWSVVQTLTATGPITPTTNISAGTNAPLFFDAVLSTNDQPPVIIGPPSNQVVSVGNTAVFSVTATGYPPPSYQWQFNGNNLSGATQSSLTIASVQATNVGNYTVIVSNVICWDTATAGLGLGWSTYLTNPILASPAIGPDGTVYLASTGNQFFALDPTLGTVKWWAPISSSSASDLTSSAAVNAGNTAVYLGSQDGYLYAFNPTNGSALWSNYLGGQIYSSPAISAVDGTVYVGTYNSGSNGLYAVNPATGNIKWSFTPDGPYQSSSSIDSSPAIGQDCSIYFTTQSGDLYSIDPAGNLQWFFPLPTPSPSASPCLDASGNIIVGSSDGYAYTVNPSGGLQQLFDTVSNSYPIQASSAVGPDGTVYVASTDGTLYAMTNSRLKWQFTATNIYEALFLSSSPAVAGDNTVYVGADDPYGIANGLYAITNGSVKQIYPTSGPIYSSPAINPADGGVVVADLNGYIYKFPGSGSPAANSSWPMFHQGVQHSGAVPNPVCAGPATADIFPNNANLNPGAGQYGFFLYGTPNSLWVIYGSSDLINWTPLSSILLNSGSSYFTDPGSILGVPYRFYQARSGSVCSPIEGFVSATIQPGANLVANPFYAVNQSYTPQNTANWLLDFMENNSYPSLPDQTGILTWNGAGFDTNTWELPFFTWLPNGDNLIQPGKAVFIDNPTNYPISVPFAGFVPQGLSSNEIEPGTNYVSSMVPAAGRIQHDLGYQPNNGDIVGIWQTNHFVNYIYSNGWSTEPTVGVGQGFLLVAAASNAWVQDFSACPQAPLPSIALTNSSGSTGTKITASPALGPDGSIYIPTAGNLFYALNPDGSIRWTAPISSSGGSMAGSATLGTNGIIYIGDAGGTLYAFNSTNGYNLWSKFLGGNIYSTPVIASDGTIYTSTTGGSSNGLFALNPTNGAIDWTFSGGISVPSSPAIGKDCSIYFVDASSRLFAVYSDGSLKWQFSIPAVTPIAGSPAIGTDGTLYVTGSKDLLAVTEDGAVEWSYETPDGSDISTSPTIGPDGAVYFGTTTGMLLAVTNGLTKWTISISGGSIYSTPALALDGTVYVGLTGGNFYAVTNGVVAWTFGCGNVYSSPAVDSSGTVYFGDSGGNLFGLAGTSGLATNAVWPMFQKNASHLASVSPGGCLLQGSNQWQWASSELLPIITSPAIGADGTVYIDATSASAASNFLYALNPSNGQVNWSNNIFTSHAYSVQPIEWSGSPTFGTYGTNQDVYVGSTTETVFSFRTNGAATWSFKLGTGTAVYSTPAFSPRGTVFAAVDEYTSGRTPAPAFSGIVAINPRTATTNWEFTPQDFHDLGGVNNGGDIDSSPTIGVDGTLYFLAEGWRLHAVSPAGTLRWFLPIPGDSEPDSVPALGADGTIYVGSHSSLLYAINSDGSLKWVFDTQLSGDVIQSEPVIGADGTVYFGSKAGLFAVTNGVVKWVFQDYFGNSFAASPALAQDGTLYIGTTNSTGNNNFFYAVKDGLFEWAARMSNSIASSAAIASNGMIYVGCTDGHVYAFSGTNGLATNAPWPMFMNNAAHTGQQLPTNATYSDCAPPFLFDGAMTNGSNFVFNAVGTLGSTWNVYASSNLVAWTEIATNLPLSSTIDPVNGNARFVETNVAGFSQRFYQLSKSNCCSRVIGFVNRAFVPGTNLVADQLYQVDDHSLVTQAKWAMNGLNALFTPAFTAQQNGTQVLEWAGQSFLTYTFQSSASQWVDKNSVPNFSATLVPGASVLLDNVTNSAFTNTFIGLIRQQEVINVHPGTNYLSTTLPMAGSITNITGYVPQNGDTVQLWNTTSNRFVSYTYVANNWSPAAPNVNVGDGFVLITTNSYLWTNTWSDSCPP